MQSVSKILVTGGAGFIGAHLCKLLLKENIMVKVLDNLEPQVHGQTNIPKNLPDGVEFILGDITDKRKIEESLEDVDAVIHLASLVGIGQSQYQIDRYTKTNILGTAILLDAIEKRRKQIKKLILASSMSVYGEGLSISPTSGEKIQTTIRNEKTLLKGNFFNYNPHNQEILEPAPTPESYPSLSNNIYALNKKHQEEYCLNFGKIFQIPTVVCRFFTVYGKGQSLLNPYTGVASIFISQIKNGKSPMIYEDGLQTRDFINVLDVVNAILLLLKKNDIDGEIFNIGSGETTTILDLSRLLIKISGTELKPKVTGKFRVGDIRHCFSDSTKISKLGFKCNVTLQDGLEELYKWSKEEENEDKSLIANQELEERELLRG